MLSDYACSERRRSKKDLKRKRKQRVYKIGGRYRTADVGKKKY